MPLLASERLAPNFTAHELGADDAAATTEIVANLRTVADWLQAARVLVGNRPIRVTSGFRTAARNEAVGGSATSDHPRGLAADFVVVGLTPYQVWEELKVGQGLGRLPAFDQLIFYAADDHVHVGLGERLRGQVLLKTTEGSYVHLAGEALAKLRGYL
jgi:zinc D-Ala-D-Ala carboxypeptidase